MAELDTPGKAPPPLQDARRGRFKVKPIHDVPPPELEAEELVARSRTGDVGAFRGIAMRYYSLIYTMAYEATGSSNQSDALARELTRGNWLTVSDSP